MSMRGLNVIDVDESGRLISLFFYLKNCHPMYSQVGFDLNKLQSPHAVLIRLRHQGEISKFPLTNIARLSFLNAELATF
jgi:hypothetical protein